MPPKKHTSESKWKEYKMKEYEKPLFDSLPGTLMLYISDLTGNCGPDSIAVLVNEKPTAQLFEEMRKIARKTEMHQIEDEFYGDSDDENYEEYTLQGRFWLDKEDIVSICVKKYKVFPIIYNSLWRPNKKEPLKKRTAKQNKNLKHNPDQKCLVCPQFVMGENLYTRPKPHVKFVIIQMVDERHYQAMGVMTEDGKIQTQFSESELPSELKSNLESLCFANAEDFQTEIDIGKEIVELQDIAKTFNKDVFKNFSNEDFENYYNANDNRQIYQEIYEKAQTYGEYKFDSASKKDKKKLAAACFASLIAEETRYPQPPPFAATESTHIQHHDIKAPPPPDNTLKGVKSLKKRVGTPQHYIDLTE